MFQAAFPLQGSEMHAQTPPEPGPLRPTAQGLSISNELHAITIIEAARQFPEFFPLIVRRPGHIELSMAELESVISHGNAFVFVPSAQNGLVRWSDCKRWSKSRQFKPFFRYFEEPGPRIRNDDEGNEFTSSEESNDDGRSPTFSGLVKWTYTVFFTPDLQEPQGEVQYRLVWYVDPTRRHDLSPLSAVPALRVMQIPWSHYYPLQVKPPSARSSLSAAGGIANETDSLPYDRFRPNFHITASPSERLAYKPQPTFQLLSPCNEEQAILFIEAARQLPQKFPLVMRRPTPDGIERSAFEQLIVHGNAFVYVVTEGLVRWHDYKRWTNSHSLPPFLRYDQLAEPTSPGVPHRKRMNANPTAAGLQRSQDDNRQVAANTPQLQRWTYSAHFSEGPDTPVTSYRLIWYVDPTREQELHAVSSVPELRKVSVPWHMYRRWNGEYYAPTATPVLPPNNVQTGPRRLAPKPIPSRSEPLVVRSGYSSWLASKTSSPTDERPRGTGHVLPPLRMPIQKATTPVRGVGYQESGWGSEVGRRRAGS